MKHLFALMLLCAAVGPARAQGAAAPAGAPHKLALLVGISNYQRAGAPNSWWNVGGANDVATMKQVLVERFGFAPGDIVTLSDAGATRGAIVGAFEQLINRARPGDIAFFQFSGHGQLLRDDNGDEADGLDESLVPFDAPSQKAVDGAKTNLRDDQLGALLDRLRGKMLGAGGKVAGNISLVIDAGFAGDVPQNQAGILRQRGRGWNATLDGAPPARKPGGKLDSTGGLLEQGGAAQQGFIVLSAADKSQSVREVKDEQGRAMGALSFYLTRALIRMQPGLSYRGLHERLSVDMNGTVGEQRPQLEGAADTLLLAGAVTAVAPYIVAQSAGGDNLTLSAGTLQGASVGSRVALYNAGSDVANENNRFAEAEIVTVGATSSTARLVGDYAGKVPAEKLQAARAVEIEHNYGDSRLKVLVEGIAPLMTALQEADVVSTEGVNPDTYDVVVRRENGKIMARRRDNMVVAQVDEDDETAARLRKALVGHWRWRFLSQLHNDNPTTLVKIQLRVVPVEVRTDNTGTITAATPLARPQTVATEVDRLTLQDGDYVMIEMRNSGTTDAYVSILDLSPDGSISPIFPHPEIAYDNKIPADNQWHTMPLSFTFQMGKPYGTEIFKAIATRDPVDLTSLFQRPTSKYYRGASANPLGKLLLSASTGKRGAGLAGVPPDDWATTEVPFEIKPKAGP